MLPNSSPFKSYKLCLKYFCLLCLVVKYLAELFKMGYSVHGDKKDEN